MKESSHQSALDFALDFQLNVNFYQTKTLRFESFVC